MDIVKVYKESLPNARLIGKCYRNEDRDEAGTFGRHWQQWFQENWFKILRESCPGPGSNDSVGAMRMAGLDGAFEYWIGILCPAGTPVPEGFESTELAACELGVCWLYGNEQNGELYGDKAFDQATAAMAEKGWKLPENGWFFERYNYPRFIKPDEKGNVILDFCACLAK